MKTVNKYILASCVFCYFMSLYLFADKFGIMRLISRHGLHHVIDNWPENLPSLNIVYICLAIYTLSYAVLTYWILKVCTQYGKEMEALSQDVSTLHNYSASLSLIVSRYNRICREKRVPNKMQCKRLPLLEKQVSALPASVFNSSNANNRIAQIVDDINAVISNIEMTVGQDFAEPNLQLCSLVESAIEDVQRLRINSITIK